MKKRLLLFFVLLLCLSIVSCNSQTHKQWSKGKIDSDVYVSEFAEIKFVKNSSWDFEALDNTVKTDSVIDMSAINDTNKVEVIFSKVDDLKNTSAKQSLEDMVSTLSNIGWEFGRITEKDFCGKKYFTADGFLTPTNYRCYMRRIGDYEICINIFADNTDFGTIESMFEKLDIAN